MPHANHRILAIDPGTKFLGIAILDGPNLMYYGVKTISDRTTAQKILRHITDLIKELVNAYQPGHFAIEKTFVVQKSAALLSVAAEEMKKTARDLGLPVYEYWPKIIRKLICKSASATKRDVAKVVAKTYPELARHLNTKNNWDEMYYSNLFDAVAVGLMCRQELVEHTKASD